jgi:hypothetical protein
MVELSEGAAASLEFTKLDWRRLLKQGSLEADESGLIELADNNPWVCADSASVPSPAATLALIALGPLARACLIKGEVILQYSRELDWSDLGVRLEEIGVADDVSVAVTDVEEPGIIALNAFIPLAPMEDWDEVDALYEEAYGRSFYVRPFEGAVWSPDLVAGRPWALYDLRLTEGDQEALITCRVMADVNGKAGAAQMVHAFNVMCGFEENLGIPETLATA